MRLKGPVAKIFSFEAREPQGPSLISRPFDIAPTPPAALQGLRALTRSEIDEQHVFLDVPFVHQQHINLCGDASANMLLGFFGKQQIDLTKNPRGVLEGLERDDLASLLRSKGINPVRVTWPLPGQLGQPPTWTTKKLCSALKKHGPIICAGRLPNDVVGHYVVLVGASDGRVAFHDPWSGPRQTSSLAEFNSFLNWTDNDAMIAGANKS